MGPVLRGQSRHILLFPASHLQVSQLRHYVACRHRHQRFYERCRQNCQQLLQLQNQFENQDETNHLVESDHKGLQFIFFCRQNNVVIASFRYT